MTRKIVPFRRPRSAVAVAQDHTLDAVCYLRDGDPEALRLAQYHVREADRLIDLYRGQKAA